MVPIRPYVKIWLRRITSRVQQASQQSNATSHEIRLEQHDHVDPDRRAASPIQTLAFIALGGRESGRPSRNLSGRYGTGPVTNCLHLGAVSEYFGVLGDGLDGPVLASKQMPSAVWLVDRFPTSSILVAMGARWGEEVRSLGSDTGGTDIYSGFIGYNPREPVHSPKKKLSRDIDYERLKALSRT